MLKFRQYLIEYLTDDQEKEFKHIQMTDKARADTDGYFGVGNDHVREELVTGGKSDTHKRVEAHLGMEIPIEQYREGKILTPKGNKRRFGGMISDKTLRDDYSRDAAKMNAKKGGEEGFYITAHRGHQVAGQTNPTPSSCNPSGHSWKDESCKNIEDGSNREYLPLEVRNGTVAVFGHDRDGKEIYRATLQPHHDNTGRVAYAVNSEYGLKHPAFTERAHEIASKLSGEYRGGVFKISKYVYNNKPTFYALHPKASKEDLDAAMKDRQPYMRSAVIVHPSATKEHLDVGLADADESVRKLAVQNKNLSSEQMFDFIKNLDKEKSPVVKNHFFKHPKLTEAHLNAALDSPDEIGRRNAVLSDNITGKNLDKAMQHTDKIVRRLAIGNKNIEKRHIDVAMKDPDPFVKGQALHSDKATDDQVRDALRDPEPLVRSEAEDEARKREIDF